MEYNKQSIGHRIKAIRQSLGLTLEQFGSIIDKSSKSNVSKWEHGVSIPNNERLKIIATLGKISTNELLYGSIEDFRYSIIKELFELNMVDSKMKENNLEMYRAMGGLDFINEVYKQVEKEKLGYDDEDKIRKIFKLKYNLKLVGYYNAKENKRHMLEKETYTVNLNLVAEHFEREETFNRYNEQKNTGDLRPLKDEEITADIILDDIILSNDEIAILQKAIEKIRTDRKQAEK